MRDTECDYLILGAGSAGCVLANRLSQDTAHQVHIVEAGPMDHKLLVHIPAGVYHAYKDPSINWNYQSELQPDCANRQIELPRGKVIGGSSSINSMVYMRGHPLDYDRWAKGPGLEPWTHAQCLPYFKRCETSSRGESTWRGGSGPLGVTQGALQNPLFDALMLAGDQSGQGTSDDLNGYKPEGIARLDSTVKDGRRSSAAVAHLKPALTRSNLSLTTHALVQKILIENNRAIGVEYLHKGKLVTQRARKAVLLCCGAIKSPQLLMLSGIGDTHELAQMGIDTVVNLPGVGKNLQDHLTITTAYECTQPITLDSLSKPLKKLAVGSRWLFKRDGVGASNIWEMGGLVFGNDKVAHPNLQYHFTPVYSEYVGRKIKLFQGFQLNVDQLRPKSRGTVTLRSNNPADRPLADFNYLDQRYDVLELIEGYRAMHELLQQPAFDEFRGKRINPAPGIESDADIEAWIRATCSTDYHPCGTCKMGDGNDAVVNSKLQVHGVEGLHIVDASVMPDIVSGNLNAPTQMIAERAADFILQKPSLAAEHANYHYQTNR